jgi:hypothetical protein
MQGFSLSFADCVKAVHLDSGTIKKQSKLFAMAKELLRAHLRDDDDVPNLEQKTFGASMAWHIAMQGYLSFLCRLYQGSSS